MKKRTKALQITKEVKHLVWLRDRGCCINCGRQGPVDWACAHYIARSHGGRGDTPKNILTLCPDCHSEYDNSTNRAKMKLRFHNYLMQHYDDLDGIVYDKWSIFK